MRIALSLFVFDTAAQLQNAHEMDITATAVSATLDLVATGDATGMIHLWNLSVFRLRSALLGHTEAIASLTFVDPYPLLVSTDSSGLCAIWHVRGSPLGVSYRCLVRWSNIPFTSSASVSKAAQMGTHVDETALTLEGLEARKAAALRLKRAVAQGLACCRDEAAGARWVQQGATPSQPSPSNDQTKEKGTEGGASAYEGKDATAEGRRSSSASINGNVDGDGLERRRSLKGRRMTIETKKLEAAAAGISKQQPPSSHVHPLQSTVAALGSPNGPWVGGWQHEKERQAVEAAKAMKAKGLFSFQSMSSEAEAPGIDEVADVPWLIPPEPSTSSSAEQLMTEVRDAEDFLCMCMSDNGVAVYTDMFGGDAWRSLLQGLGTSVPSQTARLSSAPASPETVAEAAGNTRLLCALAKIRGAVVNAPAVRATAVSLMWRPEARGLSSTTTPLGGQTPAKSPADASAASVGVAVSEVTKAVDSMLAGAKGRRFEADDVCSIASGGSIPDEWRGGVEGQFQDDDDEEGTPDHRQAGWWRSSTVKGHGVSTVTEQPSDSGLDSHGSNTTDGKKGESKRHSMRPSSLVMEEGTGGTAPSDTSSEAETAAVNRRGTGFYAHGNAGSGANHLPAHKRVDYKGGESVDEFPKKLSQALLWQGDETGIMRCYDLAPLLWCIRRLGVSMLCEGMS